jgi:hypothetical protein
MQGAPNLSKSCTRPYISLCYRSLGLKIGVRAYSQILANPPPPASTFKSRCAMPRLCKCSSAKTTCKERSQQVHRFVVAPAFHVVVKEGVFLVIFVRLLWCVPLLPFSAFRAPKSPHNKGCHGPIQLKLLKLHTAKAATATHNWG